MRDADPAHQPRQRGGGRAGAQEQVPVVGHQAVAEQADGVPPQALGQDAEEGVEVGRLVEKVLAAVAAVEHVVDHAGRDGPGGAGHRTPAYRPAAGAATEISDVPLSAPRVVICRSTSNDSMPVK